jgi:hypothetical protein
VEDWLALDADQRRSGSPADLRTSAALLLLEQASLRRQLLLAQDEVKQRYLSARALKDGSWTRPTNPAGDSRQQWLPQPPGGTAGATAATPEERKHLEQESRHARRNCCA